MIHWLDSLPDELDLSVGGLRASECPNAYEVTQGGIKSISQKSWIFQILSGLAFDRRGNNGYGTVNLNDIEGEDYYEWIS